ncbi:MAG: 3-phosphoserine/phosphohydroxythreonine transaminase [Firmicutes bacterium]|nr:3-phosphoserine/phosphohydroxythreonine transaminase [Bacillota bacterium]
MKRAFNFNAGPAALPLPVLEEAQAEFLDFKGTGMSVLEISHRSKEYDQLHNEVQESLRRLMEIPPDYRILFLQGGASLQFAMVPQNLLSAEQTANYILTGVWSEKALAEAERFGKVKVGASSKEAGYSYIPSLEELKLEGDEAYLHLTTNNTIYGTQWRQFPQTEEVPLIADMSSDILSRPIDINQFSLIYAGAQKNLGPAGVTVVIAKERLLQAKENLPTMLQYSTHAQSNSLFNTPPTFAIYMLGKVLEWVEKSGGVKAIQSENQAKAEMLYATIDQSNGFYQGHARKESRSVMNISFNLPSQELEGEFLQEAAAAGFVGLKGHRLVGGCRASIYNAVPLAACEALRDFMLAFKQKN